MLDEGIARALATGVLRWAPLRDEAEVVEVWLCPALCAVDAVLIRRVDPRSLMTEERYRAIVEGIY